MRIGGAVSLENSAIFTFENCRFVSNVVVTSGGGVSFLSKFFFEKKNHFNEKSLEFI